MSDNYKIINIEAGMPTVNQAEKRLDMELSMAKRLRVTAIKIIHGYGSTGIGGKLKNAIRRYMTIKKQTGKIKAFVAGEDWSIFNQTSREIMDACRELSKDSDLDRFNSGITVVLL